MNHYNKSIQEQRYKHHRKDSINNPSFSSTLLDTIYRSIDEGEDNHKTNMKKTKHGGVPMKAVEDDEIESFRRACFDDKGGKIRRKSMADYENAKSRMDMNNNNMKTGSLYSMQRQNRPRLVRTSLSSSSSSSKPEQEGFVVVVNDGIGLSNAACYHKHGRKENGFVKTIKKVKQPISPGGKLASFLSSIFNSSSAKKSRRNIADHHSNSEMMMMNSTRFGTGHESTTTTCSSASSFSRSCLSKTTTTTTTTASTSRNNVVNTKRSVRFCPVSTVILDEGCPPYVEKSMYQSRDSISAMVEESRRVEEAARDLLNKYKSNEPEYFGMRLPKNGNHQDVDYDDDNDDAASCASSDLFELDNLSAIGIDQKRYREELPVYETTHLDTNLAIAKGLIL